MSRTYRAVIAPKQKGFWRWKMDGFFAQVQVLRDGVWSPAEWDIDEHFHEFPVGSWHRTREGAESAVSKRLQELREPYPVPEGGWVLD